MVEFVEHGLQLLTQRGRNGNDTFAGRIVKFNPVGVKEQTPQPKVFHKTVEIGISVFQVTGQWVTDMRGMNTNLVCSARFQLHIHQCCRSVV
jgi:hypothetical protein